MTALVHSQPAYRHALPQLGQELFITDGGLETTLIFHEGCNLQYFAAFDLLRTAAGTAILQTYFRRYIEMALKHRRGIVLESPTWRANRDWAVKLGYDSVQLAQVNRAAVSLLSRLRREFSTASVPMVISGNIGPRGDGYRPEMRMSEREAEGYHSEQIGTFASTEVDMVAAFTMNYLEEAIGIARAARAYQLPLALSFTVETDGCLPSGESLAQAIQATDAATDNYPAYYMINCAHPSHFAATLRLTGQSAQRIRGIRANASRRSHAELDQSTDLDDGNPKELGADYVDLAQMLPLTVVGGCCGTDHRHVEAMCEALAEKAIRHN